MKSRAAERKVQFFIVTMPAIQQQGTPKAVNYIAAFECSFAPHNILADNRF
jgi:hypothetical protein